MGGDTGQKNIWLINSLLQLYENFSSWLFANSLLISTTVYTILRLIPDHTRQLFDSVREREVALCVNLLRNKVNM
jgi:integrator complex subunit 3